MSINVNDIAAPSADAWKPEVGESVKGVITYATSSQRPSYDGKKTEESLRIVIETDDGEEHTIFATVNTDVNGDGYAKRDAKAIAAAVRAAGATSLEIGGTLAMKRIESVPTDFGPANAYVAEYRAPEPGAGVDAEAAADGAVTGLI